MNERARRARRMLRDHRRSPYVGSHIRWVNGRYQIGYLHWYCPRCPKPTPAVSGQWRLEALVRSAEAGAALEKLRRDYERMRETGELPPPASVCITPEMAVQLIHNVGRSAVERDPVDGDIVPND